MPPIIPLLDEKSNGSGTGSLRSRAEARLTEAQTSSCALPTERLQYELGVYEIELEMQNEELREAQEALEARLKSESLLH